MCYCKHTPLQSLVAHVQVTPFWQGLFQLQEHDIRAARAAAVLALGLIALVGARSSAQAYLHAAMVQWWTHKHAGQSVDAGQSQRMGIFIKMRADFINVMFCKVQLLWGWSALGAELPLYQCQYKQCKHWLGSTGANKSIQLQAAFQ